MRCCSRLITCDVSSPFEDRSKDIEDFSGRTAKIEDDMRNNEVASASLQNDEHTREETTIDRSEAALQEGRPGHMVDAFAGADYGNEYLDVALGECVSMLSLDPVDPGWAFGIR